MEIMVKIRIKNENKKEKFLRIAENRTQRILNDLRLLGNCSNTSVYSYDDVQTSRIFKAIEDELKRVKILFSKNKNRSFSLR